MLQFSHINKQSGRHCYTLNGYENLSKIINWSLQFENVIYLDSNSYYLQNQSEFSYHNYENVLAFSRTSAASDIIHSTEALDDKLKKNSDWAFGYFSYDLKNEFFKLESSNIDHLAFNSLSFFIPEFVLFKNNKGQLQLESKSQLDIEDWNAELNSYLVPSQNQDESIEISRRFSKQEYLETVNSIKEDIQLGEIYELNFCQEFYNPKAVIDPWTTYKKLVQKSPTPFSAFVKNKHQFLMASSPERYLTKKDLKVIAQPIKGTIRSSGSSIEDIKQQNTLRNDPKERAENIMIVDLLRNDLSITACKSSVEVEELCGIYPFKNLHQMISTVSSRVSVDQNNLDLIKSTFPMGSMTGAPKLRAMELIEKYEKSKRGLYSGAVGYFSPEGDFDFNVVIRSILYNQDNKYLSFSVGSAITIKSDAEKEYEECLLKAESIRQVL